MKDPTDLSFWRWFFNFTPSSRTGLKGYLDRWLPVHFILAIGIAHFGDITADTANSLCIPFMGIMIALTVAWYGNLTALFNSDEIIELSKYYNGGIIGYAFHIQAAILFLFLSIILWALFGFQILKNPFLPLFISSITIRDSWHVILFAQQLTIAKAKIIQRNKTQK